MSPKKRIQKQFKVQKMRNYKNFGSKHFELKFKVKKKLDSDIWSKNFKSKTVRVQKIFKFEKKNQKIWVQNHFGLTKFWINKIFGLQNFGSKLFLFCVQKILGLEKF